MAQSNIVPALSSPGQNESGVAVHDDRIYVVGGYSIWTNEPLACIQVRDVAFRFSPRTAVACQGNHMKGFEFLCITESIMFTLEEKHQQ